MYNLAGLPEEVSSQQCRCELTIAGITCGQLPATPSREVRSRAVGMLYFPREEVKVTFTRAWYYWVVELSKPVPLAAALKLNDKHGSVVRVDGYAGGKEPHTGVSSYHIDTNYGLIALRETLEESFGPLQHFEPGTVLHDSVTTVMATTTEEDSIRSICSLSKNARLEDKSYYLLAALEKCETDNISYLIPWILGQLADAYTVLKARSMRVALRQRRGSGDRLHFLMEAYDASLHLDVIAGFKYNGNALSTHKSGTTRRKERRLWRTIETYLLREIKGRRQDLSKKTEESTMKYYEERIALNLLFLSKTHRLLGKDESKVMTEARSMIAALHPYSQDLLLRLPESESWQKYKGPMAQALHKASAYLYPGS